MVRKLFLLVLAVVFISACSFLSTQPTQPPPVTDQNPAEPTATGACPEVPPCPTVEIPTPVPVIIASMTPFPTNTPVPTNTAVPSATSIPKPYMVQPNTPLYLQNFAHPNLACNWLGVAGQVFDKSGKPVSDVVVVVDGALSDNPFEQIGLTGKAVAYGDGGYELVLSNNAIASTSPLTISLFDLGGNALSDPFPFNSVGDCKKNLILINFVAN